MVVKAAIFSAILTTCFAAILYWVFQDFQYILKDWQPATCEDVEFNCFCERIRSVGIKQPVNTLSAFAYVMLGVFIISFRHSSVTKTSIEYPLYASKRNLTYIYSISLVLVGLGTAFYHATLTFIGQTLDIAGMYLIALSLIVYSLVRLWRWTISRSILVLLISGGALLIIATIVPGSRRYLFAALVGVILLAEIIYYKSGHSTLKYVYLTFAFVSIIVGHIFWRLDYYKILCNPDSIIQGHAIWHLLGVLAAYLAYRFYMSEEVKPGSVTWN